MAYNQQFSRADYYREEKTDEQKKAELTDINPHIPQFIAKAPWYASTTENTLEHQRITLKPTSDPTSHWYTRGARSEAAKSFRKGACNNCGALSHQSKVGLVVKGLLEDCMERPRKTGARYTGRDIQPDERIEQFALGFDAKRDRWNGYNPLEQLQQVKDWELVEDERKSIRILKNDTEAVLVSPLDAPSQDEEEDGEHYAETAAVVGQKVDTISRTTVRNLRIREDTAKYLLNLDVHSAHYDPKTRSMRGNPNTEKDPEKQNVVYAGDNFERWTGEATQMAKLQSFAWRAGEVGKQVHLQANPSQAELLFREYQKRKTELSSTIKESILERYGGEEHLKAPPKELLMAQSEHYVEYAQTGKVIKGMEAIKILTTSFPSNHTTVWGSYWHDGAWGYACCHAASKNAYCSGQAGIAAAATSNSLIQADLPVIPTETLVEQHRKTLTKKFMEQTAETKESGFRKRVGEGAVEIDAKKLKAAIEREKGGGKKGDDVTEEELEAYRMLNRRADDPMAGYKGE